MVKSGKLWEWVESYGIGVVLVILSLLFVIVYTVYWFNCLFVVLIAFYLRRPCYNCLMFLKI